MKKPLPPQLDQALQALKDYGPGSSRADLVAIDEAVKTASADDDLRRSLEDRFLETMSSASTTGQAYLASKLALIGSAKCVDVLAELLVDSELTDPACRALEALPVTEAIEAIRARLPELEGISRIGAIHALGRRRDGASVRLFARLLQEPAGGAAEAALASLGRIGSPEAGRELRKFLKSGPDDLQSAAVHAARECTDRLKEDGHEEEAERLLQALD